MVCFFNGTATTEIYTYVHTRSLHVVLPIYRIGLAELDVRAPCRRKRRRRLLVQPLDDDRIVRMDDRAAASRVDERRILLDRVQHLHLISTPTGPGGDADIFLRQQRRDLVRLVGVGKGAQLEGRCCGDIVHVSTFIAAGTMV